MRYEMMLPHQIRTAIVENSPVVLPLGVLEYHGEHPAVGMDTLAVVKTLDILEGAAASVMFQRETSAVVSKSPVLAGAFHGSSREAN